MDLGPAVWRVGKSKICWRVGWSPREEVRLQLESKDSLEPGRLLPQGTSAFSLEAFD